MKLFQFIFHTPNGPMVWDKKEQKFVPAIVALAKLCRVPDGKTLR